MIKDDRKKRVIKAAIKIIAENGYTHAKITDIAKEAGVASGIIYSRNFFINKLDLLLSIILEFWITLNHEINTKVPDDLAPTEKLKRIVAILDELLTKDKDSLRLSKVIHVTIPITYFIKEKELQAKRKQVTVENRKLLRTLDSIIIEGQEMGLFVDNIKAQVLRQILFGAYELLLYGLSLQISYPGKNVGYKKKDIPPAMNLLLTKFISK